MNAAIAMARRYGVVICFSDLGDWGRDELRSEYDPRGCVIRLNLRLTERLAPPALGEFVTLAVGHELYHHREQIGEIAVIADREGRERAADAFAHELLAQT